MATRYHGRARVIADHYAKTNLPGRVYRQMKKPGGILRKQRVGGVREISSSKDVKKVMKAILEEASTHELVTEKMMRPLRRTVERGKARDIEKLIGAGPEAKENGEKSSKKHHIQPRSAIDDQKDRMAYLKAIREGATGDDVEGMRIALQRHSGELSEKEQRELEFSQRMAKLREDSQDWRKRDAELKKGKKDGKRSPEEGAQEIANRQVVNKPPNVIK